MTLYIPDYVRVTIDGSDRTDYVIAYQRHSSICTFSDTFGFELSFEIPVAPEPYDAIIIRELYDGDNEKVLSGYIIDVTQSGDTGSFIINGQDKTLLLDDYFIPTQHFANGESATYWISWYANQVGLNVQYDALNVSAFVVEEGSPMGMMTCSQGLAMLERLAAVYIKYDANIDKLRVFRINTAEPIINITNNATTRFQRELGTEKTRNKVVVYGGHQYNIFTGESTQVIATATTVLNELIVDKTVALANPLIRRQTVANLIASRILEVVDDIDDVVNIEVAGFYPEVDVGDYVAINIGRGDFTYSGDREITTIETSVGTNGAITIFTVGEKCPRISIIPPLSIVYATATTGGVLVSYDGGESFEPFNAGIVSTSESDVGPSGIDGLSIAANRYSQLMAIADNKLYKRVGKYGSWGEVTNLGDPSNDEGVYPQSYANVELVKVEKEIGYYGRFHTLAKSITFPRWWVYWTGNFGITWDSMQLYVPGSGYSIGSPSGLPIGLINGSGITHNELITVASGAVDWTVYVTDLEGSYSGGVTVLVSGAAPVDEIPETIYILQDYLPNRARLGYWDGTTTTITDGIPTIGFIVAARIWSCPTNRDIAYAAVISNDGADSTYTGGHAYVYKTVDGGDNWTKVHDVQLIATSAYCFISSYTVNFDTLSTETSVKVAFNCFYSTATVNVLYAKARFVTSNPTGSTSYNDVVSSVIDLEYAPYIGGTEYFDDFVHNNNIETYNWNPAWKNASIGGVTWAGTGLYGWIRLISDNSWVDTLHCAVIVKLDFSAETVTEFNKKSARYGSPIATPTAVYLCSARSTDSVYASSIGGLGLITPTSWGTAPYTGSVSPYNDFSGYNDYSKVFMGYYGYPYYTFRTVNTSKTYEDTSFYPDIVGNLNRPGACQLNKQVFNSTNHWCVSDGYVLGDPDGFCYTANGVDWTSHWGNTENLWDFTWRTWE